MVTRLRLFAILFLLAGIPGLLRAQWSTIFTTSSTISCVKALDNEGSPNILLLGLQDEIQVSTDGGANWAAAKATGLSGTVNDFSFKNADTGWASVNGTSGNPGLWVTHDGGQAWEPVTTAHPDGNAVYYHKPNGRLFFSSSSDSAEVSTNLGGTWKNFAPIAMTGYSFSNDYRGILGTTSSVNAAPILFTVDGGLTWKQSSLSTDTWQPLAVRGLPIAIASSPSDQLLYISQNGGDSWAPVTNIGGGLTGYSGTVRGDACDMYATLLDGVLSSINNGLIWTPILGAPTGATINSRFYVSSTLVYTLDGKHLYSATRASLHTGAPPFLPAIAPIHLVPNNVVFRTGGCNAVDTVLYLYGCDCANLRITGSTVTGSPTVTAQVGPSRPLCGSDSIRISYLPTGSTPDTALVHVHIMQGTTVADTVIRVIGPGMPISVTPSALNFYIRMKGCQRVDTTLYLTNTLCNTLTLTQAYLNDQTHAVLNLPFSLPKTINPRETIALPITANAVAAGTYYYVLTYQVTAPSGEVVTRDVGVNLLVATTPKPQIQGLNWTVQDLCSLHDSAIYYVNTLCDTITINGINLGSANDFKIPNLTFPIKLAPGEYLRIPLTIVPTAPGNYSTKLNIFGFIQDVPIDSSLNLSLRVNKALTPQATVTPNGAVFGVVSTCDSTREKTLIFNNTTCVPLTVSSIVVTVPGDSTYTFPYHFPSGITLQPGDKDSIIVHFWPKINGGNGSIQVTYTYKDQTKIVLYAVSGFGSDKVAASLGTTTLDFDSIRFCDTATLSTTLENGPCADIVISRVTVLSGAGFTVTSPAQGETIGIGTSKNVTVRFTPTASGDVTGSVEIQITDKSGQVGVSDTLNFTAHVKPPVRNYALGSIASDTLLACNARDTTLRLINNGECDVIKIAGVSSTNPKVTITNAAALAGMSLQVGQSAPVLVHVDPANVTADITGSIIIQASPDISIPYSIPVKTCATTPTTVTLDVPDSTFNTANCTTKTIEYTISVNINSSTVDVISLEDLTTQFGNSIQIVGGGSLPIVVTPGSPLKFRVTYDPDATGSNTVYLRVHSADGKLDKRIKLTGISSGAPVQARLGVQTTAGGNTVSTNASDQKIADLAVILRDAVDPSVGLQSARFHMQYNKNVLTKTRITGLNGWTVAKDQGSDGDLDFTLTYSGGAIPAGQQVATVSFLPQLSTVTTTAVTIAQTHFNDNDPNFERCKLGLNVAGDLVTVNVGMTCADSVIQRALLGQPIVADLSIVPNPSGVHSATTINYKTYEDADVKVEVLNLSGAALAESYGRMPAGVHSVVLPSNSLRSGTYLVRITAGAMQKVSRFVVE